jgi:pilus assembly protein TadC
MLVAQILDHWEFLSGLVLLFVMLWQWKEEPVLPDFLLEPGLYLANVQPNGYTSFLIKTQIRSGWRTNDALARLMAIKLYLTIFLSATLYFCLGPWQAIAGLLIFFVPDVLIFSRMVFRKKQIVASMPTMLDLMVLCVEAGLGLNAMLHRIAEKGDANNPLYAEMKLLNNDLLFGMSHDRAYDELFLRTGVTELKSICSALNQCTKKGLSIATILRAQSEFWRSNLARQAEKRANKLPILLSFPTWLLIMPAVLIVTVSPAILKQMDMVNIITRHPVSNLFPGR